MALAELDRRDADSTAGCSSTSSPSSTRTAGFGLPDAVSSRGAACAEASAST